MKARKLLIALPLLPGLLCAVSTSFGQAVSFAPLIEYPIGSNPTSVATADLNHDGKLDLVVTAAESNTVSVLLGMAGGMFGAKTDYATGTQPMSVAIGDFNRDGAPDLAVANHISRTLSILLGDGTGAFVAGPVLHTASVGNGARIVVVGDFNHDGKPDLAVTSDDVENPGKINVFLGDGTGSFVSAGIFLASVSCRGLATADLDRDGNLDLAAGGRTTRTLLGDGMGSFSTATDFARASSYVAIGDFNRDGKPDLALGGSDASSSGVVAILLGDGNGSFGPATEFATPLAPVWIAVADVNGDGKPDLVTANPNSSTVSILFGNGGGSFTRADLAMGTRGPLSVAVGDFDRDGALDLAVANHSGTVSILLSAAVNVEIVHIDIKPGSDPNSINLSSAGNIPVAILSTTQFDAPAAVDPDSLSLAGAAVKLIGKSGRFQCSNEDVNGDGLLDLVCHFDTTQFMIEPGESIAVLEGRTFDGRFIRGEDSIRIVQQ